MSEELTKRILSSIVLIPITLFFIIQGSFLFLFFIFICLGIIIYEWHMMSKNKSYRIIGFIFLFLSFYTIYKLRIDNDYWFLLFVIIIMYFNRYWWLYIWQDI
jgi:phosphatidate cytidylyltransferase